MAAVVDKETRTKHEVAIACLESLIHQVALLEELCSVVGRVKGEPFSDSGPSDVAAPDLPTLAVFLSDLPMIIKALAKRVALAERSLRDSLFLSTATATSD